jgi:hypothetical protein
MLNPGIKPNGHTKLEGDGGRRRYTPLVLAGALVAVSSVIYLGKHRTASDDQMSDGTVLREYKSPGIAALSRWASFAYTPLESLGPDYQMLELRYHSKDSGMMLTDEQRVQIPSQVRRALTLICAGTFQQYERAIRGSIGNRIVLNDMGRHWMKLEVLGGTAADPSQRMGDEELLETYWILRTRMGQGSRYFTGICLDESYVQGSVLESLPPEKHFPNPYADDAVGPGRSTRPTSFNFGDERPAEEYSRGGCIQIIDVRLMLKTCDADIAYPICVRLWWSSKARVWIPWFCIEYNNVARRYNVVF